MHRAEFPSLLGCAEFIQWTVNGNTSTAKAEAADPVLRHARQRVCGERANAAKMASDLLKEEKMTWEEALAPKVNGASPSWSWTPPPPRQKPQPNPLA
jgi:hypothetical protein